jgi:hypothetical protein
MDRPDLASALERLLGTGRPEVGCEECFAQLDRHVELELAGGDADAAIPGMRAHLAGCPACREDHESLRALVRTLPGPTLTWYGRERQPLAPTTRRAS